MSGSRSTTTVAGVAAGGALLLQTAVLGGLRVQPTPDIGSTLLLQGPAVDAVVALLTVVAAVALARGVRGEPGLLRASRVAGIAVLVHAAAVVAGAVVRPLVGRLAAASVDPVLPAGAVAATQAVDAVEAAALVVLAAAVVRGRLLEPVARVSLVVLAAAAAALGILPLVVAPFASGDGGSPLVVLLLAVPPVILVASTGVVLGLVLHGRSASVRQRAEAIRRAW
ncbi:hypothetical protein ACMA46_12815 [Clavibacter sp. Sh2141]|uniref:hypothetical protein n=1 Tax=Clavibacter sp. Sh2141 TaxID=3395374 RepID=UPI0039BCFFCE